MKKILSIFLATALAALSLSCTKESEVSAISVSVKIDDAAIDQAIIPESYEVTITNFSTSVSATATTENGIAAFDHVVPGLYKVTASASVSANGSAYTISGAMEETQFLQNGDQIVLAVKSAKESALIFKEIYYSGSKTDKFYMRDQFYEIYNNSDVTVYADGICIAETIFAEYDFSVIYEYVVPGKDAKDYIFSQLIWQIPGDGTQYPVKPGESIIIAQWATDHTTEKHSGGASVVNLTGAEFEAFCGEKEAFGGIVLTDEAAINLNMAVNAMGRQPMQWLTPVGGSRYILFKPSTPLRQDNFCVPGNVASTSLKQAHEVLITDVIDAVQTIADETVLQHLGLPAVLDAGAIWCSKTYSGESISRKIARKVDGRIIYQDTNNTTNDFEVNPSPVIRRNGAGVPEWNTWIK